LCESVSIPNEVGFQELGRMEKRGRVKKSHFPTCKEILLNNSTTQLLNIYTVQLANIESVILTESIMEVLNAS
jgi:hypothetical protein